MLHAYGKTAQPTVLDGFHVERDTVFGNSKDNATL